MSADLLHTIRTALMECDRYAYESRARALRRDGTSHAHYMGHAADQGDLDDGPRYDTMEEARGEA